MNRAAANMMLMKFTDALDDCNRSLAIDSTNAKAVMRKASALKALGQVQPALACYEQAMELDPMNNQAKIEKDELSKAILLLKQLQEATNNISDPNKAVSYRAALPKIEGLYKIFGSNNSSLNMIKASCLQGLGRVEEAYNITNQMMRSSRYISIS